MLELFMAIILATAGQILLSHHDLRGLLLYVLATLVLLIALRRYQLGPRAEGERINSGISLFSQDPPTHQLQYRRLLRLLLFPLALTNAILAFVAASENTYRWHGVTAWLLATALFLIIFWEGDLGRSLTQKCTCRRVVWRRKWTMLAVLGAILIGFWFRLWQLEQMPPEMTSDHIEKLLDVHDLVTGQRPIFFVRNTGREPWQFYWTLMLMRLFDLDTKFFALKLGTAAVGLLMLPGVYLLGRDLFNRRVGLWAMLFSAVASWPVILSRIGLRFPFAPAAIAWSLLYLLRGLRDGRRNDFLMLGLWLGIGLHGYTAFRAMPLVVIICWATVVLIRPSSLAVRPSSLVRNALLTALIAGVVFIPLGRFSLEHPDDFWRRSISRMADPNQITPDGSLPTLLKNLKNLALMFHWKGDDVWVNTIADAPVLDPLLGGLFVLGLIVVLWRGLRLRDPIAPLLLIAGVILLLPSALSLAYPIENPSVVRSGGAIPVVMIIAALPLGMTLMPKDTHGAAHRNTQIWLSSLGAVTLAVAATIINYDRYFGDYWEQYERNALNTTEIASAIRDFTESGGDLANAWIVAWPYWIDTRGVGIELGIPPWNNVILAREELIYHLDSTPVDSAGNTQNSRFYVLHPEDRETLKLLRSLFPQGRTSTYDSKRPDRTFILFFVPRTPPQG